MLYIMTDSCQTSPYRPLYCYSTHTSVNYTESSVSVLQIIIHLNLCEFPKVNLFFFMFQDYENIRNKIISQETEYSRKKVRLFVSSKP